MNKPDLIAHIADTTSLPKAGTAKAVDAVFKSITAALGRGEEVNMVSFGAFSVTERPARTGRNPQTGEAIEIAASRSPKFKPGKRLRESVKA